MTGFTFGQPSQATTTATVNPLNSGTGFSLGGAAQTTTSNSSGAGFSFGPTSGASSGFSFAQPASTATSGLFAPAAASTVPSGLNFGFPSSSSGFTGLGAPNAATTSTGFAGLLGQASLAPTSSFGTANLSSSGTGGLFSSTSTTTVAGSGLFGIANATGSSTTSVLGQAPPISSTGGLFGTSLSSTSAPGNLFGPTPGLFNQTSTPSAGLFNQTSTPSAGLFNQTSTPSAGLFIQTSTPSAGLFNQTSTPSSGLFSQTSIPSSTGFNLNLSSQTSVPSSITNLGLGGILQTPSTTATAGLGGFQMTAVDAGNGSGTSKSDGKCVKEAPLPQDIFNTMIIFENYKDVEKKASEENIRQTAAPFHKLIDDTKKLRQHVIQLSNQHAQLHASARKLKSSVIQEAENVEMARRTQDTPMSLQGDNKSPEQFFLSLVRSFEERMTYCRNKIDEVEKCSQTNGGLSKITSEDMKEVLKKEHEMVKVLAAKVYTLHNQLLNHCCKSNLPNQPQPEALFKPVSSQIESIGIGHKDSSVLRPCLGDGGSGLLNFQSGQQRAKAVSLGAAPPTLPLGHPTSSGILGSASQSGLFGTPSSSTFPFSNSSLNFGSGNNLSSPNTFGSPSANLSGGLFGNTSLGNTSLSTFGLGNTSTFGTPKAFGK